MQRLIKVKRKICSKKFQLKCILIYHVSPAESNGELVFIEPFYQDKTMDRGDTHTL